MKNKWVTPMLILHYDLLKRVVKAKEYDSSGRLQGEKVCRDINLLNIIGVKNLRIPKPFDNRIITMIVDGERVIISCQSPIMIISQVS